MTARIRDWLSLVRFSHTLFALPFALGSLVVAERGVPRLRVLLPVLLCMVAARNAAMAFNRLADRDVDALNPRTARRHLPAGLLAPRQVALFVAVNALLFLLGAWLLNPLAGILAIPTLVVLLGYSFLKRFTWCANFGLGLALSIAPMGAWVASRGSLHAFPLLLGLAVFLWSSGFDIVYATQDYDADVRCRLHSVPQRFGIKGALRIAMALHLAMLGVLAAIGLLCPMPWPWFVASACAAAAIVYEHLFRKSASLETMNADFFLANVVVSAILMVGMFASVLVQRLSQMQ